MGEGIMEVLKNYPTLDMLAQHMLRVWPEHHKYLTARFKSDSEDFLKRTEELASCAVQLMHDDVTGYCQDYRWMCEQFIEEQIYFQRHGNYRHSSFEDVNKEIYANQSYMQRYVRGILVSQIFWANHAQAIDLFRTEFLTTIAQGADYLEIGPGHGLFFYFASRMATIASLTGWDVSESSIAETQQAMQLMKVAPERYRLIRQDIFDASSPPEQFDAVIISEVLEHLEAPDKALQSLHRVMRSGARIFINAPVNSPAPDHIYLWRTTDALAKQVQECGFTIEQAHYLPLTGRSLEYCRKYNLDISCIFIARKP